MYKYQCSKAECESTWTLQEGSLNGFVLTCPICGKGRGIFVEQIGKAVKTIKDDNVEQIVISVNSHTAKSVEELNQRIDEFRKKHSLNIISVNVESAGKEILCTIQYKLKE